MRQIEIEWVGLDSRITATLGGSNPVLEDLLWSALPYNSIQNHAMVSGKHLYHLCPIRDLVHTGAQFKEDRTKSADGTVFLSSLMHLAIKYGALSEYIPAAPVGRVAPDDIATLKDVGRRCWDAAYRTKQVIEARVTRKGERASTFRLPPPATVKSLEVQAVIAAIHQETERIWVDLPKELVNIHAGRIASGAGSYDQYFTTMLFVNGEMRPMGYGALGGLIKTCKHTDVSLDVLKGMTQHFIRVPAEFLGYCGLDDLWRLTQQTLSALQGVETKEEYHTLIYTLALYAHRLNGWNLHLFPWHHGKDYPAQSQLKTETVRRSRGIIDAADGEQA